MQPERPLIAMTMGDPAGIGPEICLRAAFDPAALRVCVPVIVGDAALLERVGRRCGLPVPHTRAPLDQWRPRRQLSEAAIVDVQAIDAEEVIPGEVDARCGRAAAQYIEAAVGLALHGEVDGLATAPIHKQALHLAEVPYPGHTEMVAALTGAPRACMMLASEKIVCSFVTTHIGFADVPTQLSTERILDVIELTHDALQRVLGKPPRIAVCGLNPHAGENGLFGRREEERLIAPAVAQAVGRGILAEGPFSPDAVFVPRFREGFDGVVCMYHDQGHIPFKLVAFDIGINLTLGLPIVRTSVDHGTAFDIAWTGKADHGSLVQALLWAAKLSGGRATAQGQT